MRKTVISILVACLVVVMLGTTVVYPVSADKPDSPPGQAKKDDSGGGDGVSLQDIDSGLTSPSGDYRWLDIADQKYADTYIDAYNYTQAAVQVQYERVAKGALKGTLTASSLKPNFAYQIKLVGNPEQYPEANERIGLAGRWWQEEWDAQTQSWTKGHNLNDKGDGSSPNPNDLVYFATRDLVDESSPTGLRYRYLGYMVFDYFITDETGAADVGFIVDSSYHVLWKTTQPQHSYDALNDGPVKSRTFDPVPLSEVAYDMDYPQSAVDIYGEWERLPTGGIYLDNGNYTCDFILTEESFHGVDGADSGNWAAAMGAEVSFKILPNKK